MLPDDLVVLDDRRGMRSLLAGIGTSPARRAAAAILSARGTLLLCTGFPVRGKPESDGPAGTIVLARSLGRLGREAVVVSWAEALEAWGPMLKNLPSSPVPRGRVGTPLTGTAITVEVCGRAGDGSYRNMMGVDIRHDTPWFEDIVGTHALVSVGDGGNEFGMGTAPQAWFATRSILPPVSTCDVLVAGQVSNWGVLAILAAMSRQCGERLLPEPNQYADLLAELASRGTIDGIRGEAVAGEDGYGPDTATAIIEGLRQWVER